MIEQGLGGVDGHRGVAGASGPIRARKALRASSGRRAGARSSAFHRSSVRVVRGSPRGRAWSIHLRAFSEIVGAPPDESGRKPRRPGRSRRLSGTAADQLRPGTPSADPAQSDGRSTASTRRRSSSDGGSRPSSSQGLAQLRSSGRWRRNRSDRPAAEGAAVEGIALIEPQASGGRRAARENRPSPSARRGGRIVATRSEGGAQRREPAQRLPRPVNRFVFEELLHPVASQFIDATRLEARRNPDRPDVGVEERERQRRGFPLDRSLPGLEPREQHFLDLLERSTRGRRDEASCFAAEIYACQGDRQVAGSRDATRLGRVGKGSIEPLEHLDFRVGAGLDARYVRERDPPNIGELGEQIGGIRGFPSS